MQPEYLFACIVKEECTENSSVLSISSQKRSADAKSNRYQTLRCEHGFAQSVRETALLGVDLPDVCHS